METGELNSLKEVCITQVATVNSMRKLFAHPCIFSIWAHFLAFDIRIMPDFSDAIKVQKEYKIHWRIFQYIQWEG